MRRRAALWRIGMLVAAALLTLGSCSEPETGTGEGADFRLVETLRFPESPEAPLTGVEDMAVTPGGDVFVIDWETPAILWFEADGRFKKKLGRAGQGPGEFDNPTAIGTFGDTLWVNDGSRSRVTFFDLEGELLGTEAPLEGVDLPEQLWQQAPIAYLRNGSVVVTGFHGRDKSAIGIHAVAPSGTTAVRTAKLNATDRWWDIEIPKAGTHSFFIQPLGFHDLFDIWSAGSAVVVVERPPPSSGTRGEYRVRIVDWAGESRRTLRHSYEPTRLQESHIEAILDQRTVSWFAESWLELFPSREALRTAFSDGLDRPEYVPPIANRGRGIFGRSVVVSRDGAVWLRQWTPPGDRQRWIVLEPGGTDRTVAAPPEMILHAVRGSRAWGVIRDSLHVPTIIRYELRPSAE